MQLSQNILVVSFYQVFPSKEKTVYSKFQDEYPNYEVFKTLGSFDLASFIEVNGHEGKPPNVLLDGVSAKHSITAYKWNDSYKSPQINLWLKDTIAAGFIFLELDKLSNTFQNNTFLHESFFNFFYKKSEWNKDQVAFYGGVGKTDIFAIIKSDKLEDLFKLASFFRSLTIQDILTEADPEILTGLEKHEIRLFFLTRTIPLISSKNIIIPREFSKLKGKISPNILISCPPGMEVNILEQFSDVKGIHNLYLGDYDLSINFEAKIDSSVLIEKLVTFRDNIDHNPTLIDTCTSIQSTHFTDKHILPYEVKEPEEYHLVPDLLYQVNKALAVRVQAFIYQLFANLNLGSVYLDVIDMSDFPMRLLGEISGYLDNTALNHSKLNNVIKMIECGEIGLLQRTSSSFNPSLFIQYSPEDLSNGVLNSITSINHIVRYILDELQMVEGGVETRWAGFILFNDVFNFQLLPGDIFSLPYSAAMTPISKSTSWLILTHELSHYQWLNLEVDSLEENRILNIVKSLVEKESTDEEKFKDQTRLKKIIETEYSTEYDHVLGELWELFSHWYDYYHFFDEDHVHYQKFTWDSWLNLSIVKANLGEYLTRSFIIYLIAKEKDFNTNASMGNQSEFLKSSWKNFIDFLVGDVNIEIPEDVLNGYNSYVIEIYYQIGAPFIEMKDSYKSITFKKRINESYENLESHIEMIEKGIIITDSIQNPFILMRECRKRILNKRNLAQFYNNSAFILSIVNQMTFLHYDEEEE